jgi:glycosyltransferase involved in cell wall biosynthesis
MPRHGIFVENRLRHVLDTELVQTDVVAPVPWFPSTNKRFGSYADFARVPKHEQRNGVDIYHPRYPLVPKLGMSSAPWLMAKALHRFLARFPDNGRDFDLIDSHYFYPEGVAATLLGEWLKRPVVITARGCDVNFIPNYYIPRQWIRWAANKCAAIVTVSEALKTRLIELGTRPEKIQVLRNGVDLSLFNCSRDREELRRSLELSRPTLLTVGRISEAKGQHFIVEAMQALPEFDLLVIGEGEWRDRLTRQVAEMGLAERVRFLGPMPHSKLVNYYQAADAMLLASDREGMANVLLESLACGTPLVATPVGGNLEVLADNRAGVLMRERTASAVADAVKELFRNYPSRSDVRDYATTFDWTPTTQGQITVFREVLGATS